jgi:hypothetical protein
LTIFSDLPYCLLSSLGHSFRLVYVTSLRTILSWWSPIFYNTIFTCFVASRAPSHMNILPCTFPAHRSITMGSHEPKLPTLTRLTTLTGEKYQIWKEPWTTSKCGNSFSVKHSVLVLRGSDPNACAPIKLYINPLAGWIRRLCGESSDKRRVWNPLIQRSSRRINDILTTSFNLKYVWQI